MTTERERAQETAIRFQLRHIVAGFDRVWSREREREVYKNKDELARKAVMDNPDISIHELCGRFLVSTDHAKRLKREFGRG